MIGNVYVKYVHEESADLALQKLTGRYYNTRSCHVELSPLTDFKEARCRQFEEAQCGRGGYCNFVHWKYVPRRLKRRLRREMVDEHPEYKRGRARGGGGGDRGRDRERRASGDMNGKDSAGDTGGASERQTSEERRAMIASWNAEAA